MAGIYYLLSLIAIWVIALWYIRNDKLGPGQKTFGLLRMKEADEPAPAAAEGEASDPPRSRPVLRP